MAAERKMNLIERALGFLAFCLIGGHNWFDGGEACRECKKPRPAGWKAK